MGVLAACERAKSEIEELLSARQGPILVALDGGSGSGKSQLAALVAHALNAAVIPLDDFFSAEIPDEQWDSFTVEERLKHVFDWNRLREHAISPLLAGRAARWHAFDFESGLRPDGTYSMREKATVREPADVILAEGAYSAGPELADLVDLAILVDVRVETRHARLRAREDDGFLAKWHPRWDAVESYYFTRVRPRRCFDLIVHPD